jgi:hypothetical protein
VRFSRKPFCWNLGSKRTSGSVGLGAQQGRQLGVAGRHAQVEAGQVLPEVAVRVEHRPALLPADRVDADAGAELDRLGARLDDADREVDGAVGVGLVAGVDRDRREHVHAVDRLLDAGDQPRRVALARGEVDLVADEALGHADQALDRDLADLHVLARVHHEVDLDADAGVDHRRLLDLGERVAAVLHAAPEQLARGVELGDLEGLTLVQDAGLGDRVGLGLGVGRSRRRAVGPAHAQRLDVGRRALADHDLDPRLAGPSLARVLAEQAHAADLGDRHHRDDLGVVVSVRPIQLEDPLGVDRQHRLGERILRLPHQPRALADVQVRDELLLLEPVHPLELDLRDVRLDPAHVLQPPPAGEEQQRAAQGEQLETRREHGPASCHGSNRAPTGRLRRPGRFGRIVAPDASGRGVRPPTSQDPR